MQRKVPKFLQDIRDSARFNLEATHGKALEDYRADHYLRRAVERESRSSARP